MQLAGKWCLITGGTSGIGLAIAQELRRRGTHLLLIARDPAKIEHARQLLLPLGGGELHLLSLDITDSDALNQAVNTSIINFSLPDIIINNAGAVFPTPFVQHGFQDLEQMLKCNFLAPWMLLQLLVPKMLQRGSGCIVNVASMAGLIGIYGYSGYAASKGAMVLFSQVLRNELKPAGLRVLLLCPGDTLTPQLEQENRSKPAETKKIAASSPPLPAAAVARTLVRQLQRNSGFYVIPGWMNKLSWWCYRWAPSLIHHIIDGDVRSVRKKH